MESSNGAGRNPKGVAGRGVPMSRGKSGEDQPGKAERMAVRVTSQLHLQGSRRWGKGVEVIEIASSPEEVPGTSSTHKPGGKGSKGLREGLGFHQSLTSGDAGVRNDLECSSDSETSSTSVVEGMDEEEDTGSGPSVRRPPRTSSMLLRSKSKQDAEEGSSSTVDPRASSSSEDFGAVTVGVTRKRPADGYFPDQGRSVEQKIERKDRLERRKAKNLRLDTRSMDRGDVLPTPDVLDLGLRLMRETRASTNKLRTTIDHFVPIAKGEQGTTRSVIEEWRDVSDFLRGEWKKLEGSDPGSLDDDDTDVSLLRYVFRDDGIDKELQEVENRLVDVDDAFSIHFGDSCFIVDESVYGSYQTRLYEWAYCFSVLDSKLFAFQIALGKFKKKLVDLSVDDMSDLVIGKRFVEAGTEGKEFVGTQIERVKEVEAELTRLRCVTSLESGMVLLMIGKEKNFELKEGVALFQESSRLLELKRDLVNVKRSKPLEKIRSIRDQLTDLHDDMGPFSDNENIGLFDESNPTSCLLVSNSLGGVLDALNANFSKLLEEVESNQKAFEKSVDDALVKLNMKMQEQADSIQKFVTPS